MAEIATAGEKQVDADIISLCLNSSMSAWIGVDTYNDYFNHPDSNLQGGVSDTISFQALTFEHCLDQPIETNAGSTFRSPRPCPPGPLPGQLQQDGSPISSVAEVP